MTKQVIRKLLTHTVIGNTETNTFERIEKELLTDKELEELIDLFCDDGEAAYDIYGICFDFSEEISLIVLDRLAEGLASYLEDNEDNENVKEILRKVEPLRAYNLDFENESKAAGTEEKED